MRKDLEKEKPPENPQEAFEFINNFVEEFFGEVFDDSVKISGKPELRSELKLQTIEFFLLRHTVENAKDIKELESHFDKKADILEEKIENLLEKLSIFTKESNAELDREAAAYQLLKLEAKNTAKDIKEIAPDLNFDFENAFKPALNIVEGQKQINNLFQEANKQLLKNPLNSFRRWRKFSRVIDYVLWFLFAILVAGLAYKLAVSEAEKLLFSYVTNGFYIILIMLVFIVLKDKVISPFIKNLLLGFQKRNLIKSIEKLHIASMNFATKLAKEEGQLKKREEKLKSLLSSKKKNK